MAKAVAVPDSVDRPVREMEFEEGTSHKFWRIELGGSSHTVTYGKVGTNGQTQTKEFASEDEAAKSYDKLVAEKLKKGYAETGTAAPVASTAKPVQSTPAATPTKVSAKTNGKTHTPAVAAPSVPSRPIREMEFADGSSHKFWKIELSGSSHTVTFGKVGTSGQTQTKDFDSEDEAGKSYDKLVAEKLKKGYSETGTAATTTPAAKPASTTIARTAKPSKSTPVVATAPMVAINLDIAREIRLNPSDWDRGIQQRRRVLQRSDPKPFDQASCLSQLAKLKTENYGWDICWDQLNLPSGLDPKEAHFWLEAMTTNRHRDFSPKQLSEKLKSFSPTGKLTSADVVKLLMRQERDLPELPGLMIGNLLSADEVMEVWREHESSKKQQYLGIHLVDGILHYVLPYWTETERKSVAANIRKDWDPNLSPPDFYEALPMNYYLAAALGLPEVAAVVSSWEDNRYLKEGWSDHYQRPQELVFGLGSAEQIASEWRRLRLKMHGENHVRTFLACTEYSALDCVRDSILAETNKERCEELLKAFTLVIAPEAAPYMLECKLSAKSPSLARQWLDENVGCAIAGLIETAGGRGKLADAAIDYLRQAKRSGHEALIDQSLKGIKPEIADRVRQEVIDHKERVYTPFDEKSTPSWLKTVITAAEKLKRAKLPSWGTPSALPAIVMGDHRLNDEQVSTLLNTLAATIVAGKHEFFDALHEHADAKSLDDFAWKLFQLWSEDGSPSKERWAMGAVGLLGGDNCALKLTPLVRNWPGESQHQRAVFGLECLRAIGSNVALMQLSGIAQKLKFKGLKTKAEEFVEAIAKTKGLTRAELEDRVVPDCGLDENGKREFSFGPRAFSFVLGAELKPMVRDGDGKIRDDLPKPSSKDDADVSKASVDEWKLLKKQIKEVAKIQAGRLEQAMVTGRRWKPEDFELLLVKHPLMTHLARKILWGSYDAKGKLIATFRVTDERDYADSAENSVSLKGAAQIGVIHPLHLTDDERSAWGEVLSDYEIVPPFPQLGRSVHALEPAEAKTNNLTRFKGMKLVAPTLVFGLEKLGWIRGAGMDAGSFDEHSKQFPAANVTAVVQYDGSVGMGWISPDEILELTDCQFVRGLRAPSGYGFDTKDSILKLGDVDPIVVSEVIADLNELKSKEK
jgi:predicted DNA-binding WGR domain protein